MLLLITVTLRKDRLFDFLMALYMKAVGEEIYEKAMGCRSGQMGLATKGTG